jgi:hypothetical protein
LEWNPDTTTKTGQYRKAKRVGQLKVVKMNTRIFLLILFASFAFNQKSAAQAPHYEINGKIEGAEGVKFYLHEYQSIGRVIIQSDTTAGINGQFKFSGSVEYPVKVRLSELADYSSPLLKSLPKKPPRGNEVYIDFFLENSTITITGKLDSFVNTTVSGSQSNDEYNTIEKPLRQLQTKLNNELVRDSKPGDFPARMNNTKILQDSIGALRKTLSKDFIKKYPKSYAGPIILDEFVRISDVKQEEIESFIAAMDPQIAKLPTVTNIKYILDKYKALKTSAGDQKLWVHEVNEKDWPGGKDLIIKNEETERQDNFSIIKTTYPPGAWELSSMVSFDDLVNFAVQRGKQYFVILKSWPDKDFKVTNKSGEGGLYCKLAFSDSRDIDLKKEFGDDIQEGLTRRDFSSVLSIYMITLLDLKKTPQPWTY